MKNLLYLLALALIVCSQDSESLLKLTPIGPTSNVCRSGCRWDETCVFGKCVKKSPQGPYGTCTGNQTCQNGYCLPNICAPCPPGVYCIWNMPCPDGFDCKGGKCYANCWGSSCKAKRCLPIVR